ncbi:MAG: hypothetical protein RID53_23070 [Coleofasciculus sp. B1-GNL1-01]|uniref:hypothetical protein n=1 Tax=Coleofasciculus sp. B1-GNL1-01 TaxID=3068484 RepID=UPI0032F9D81C
MLYSYRIKRQFAEDVKHRQSERDYSRNLSQGQRYSLRELRLFFETINDEDIKAQINLLEKAFREPVTTGLKRELNRLKRNSITGNELFIKLKQLYAQYDRHEWLNRRQKDEDYLVPIIVCSEALV